jgi:hypothetical protein
MEMKRLINRIAAILLLSGLFAIETGLLGERKDVCSEQENRNESDD